MSFQCQTGRERNKSLECRIFHLIAKGLDAAVKKTRGIA